MKRIHLYSLGGVFIVLLIGVVALFLTDDGVAKDGKTVKNDDTSRGSKSILGEGRFTEPMHKMGISHKRALNDYIKYAKFPPSSRPLNKKMTDLLNPNRRFENFIPAGGPPTGFDKENPVTGGLDAKFYYILTANKYTVVGQDSIVFYLKAANNQKARGGLLPIKILSATLNTGRSHLSYKKVEDLNLNDYAVNGDKEKGDLTYSVRITPSATSAARHHGRFQVYVKFEINGETTEALVPFEYHPEDTIQAEFTGKFREEIEDGSLVVYAEVNVMKPGFFVVDANLFDKNNEPLVYSRFKGEIKSTGINNVRLLFFGKIIKDQAALSPLKMKNLRGYRLIPGGTPDRQIIPSYEGIYNTEEYKLSVFSSEEWESPRKTAKINFLTSQAANGVNTPNIAQ